MNKYMIKYFKNNPWMTNYYSARTRCTNPKCPRYHRYGGRGIKFLLNTNIVRYLWFRDNAPSMKMPSIDRIDNNGNYEISNCRFIEMSLNRPHRRKKIL